MHLICTGWAARQHAGSTKRIVLSLQDAIGARGARRVRCAPGSPNFFPTNHCRPRSPSTSHSHIPFAFLPSSLSVAPCRPLQPPLHAASGTRLPPSATNQSDLRRRIRQQPPACRQPDV